MRPLWRSRRGRAMARAISHCTCLGLEEPAHRPEYARARAEMTLAAAAAIAGSAALGLLVSLSMFLMIGATSGVTFNVVGHVKTVLILAGGVMLFGDRMCATARPRRCCNSRDEGPLSALQAREKQGESGGRRDKCHHAPYTRQALPCIPAFSPFYIACWQAGTTLSCMHSLCASACDALQAVGTSTVFGTPSARRTRSAS